MIHVFLCRYVLPEAQAEVVRSEFDSFQKIFSDYLHETQDRVVWEKIEKLPAGSVSWKSHKKRAKLILNMGV